MAEDLNQSTRQPWANNPRHSAWFW